jgi:hypothetical protein
MNEPNLRVTVMGARDLRGVDMGKTSDPYCIINGVRNGYMRVRLVPLLVVLTRLARLTRFSFHTELCPEKKQLALLVRHPGRGRAEGTGRGGQGRVQEQTRRGLRVRLEQGGGVFLVCGRSVLLTRWAKRSS